jgi:hypothetical protein
LGELTWPDKIALHNYCKVSMWHLVEFLNSALAFWLPGHKADQYFEGNCLIICRLSLTVDVFEHFLCYLHSCDSLFCVQPELWLCADGSIPTQSWFIKQLQAFFTCGMSGQSMCVGGTTVLAKARTAPNLIQATSWWSSDMFMHYVHKNPFLFEALLVGQTSLSQKTHMMLSEYAELSYLLKMCPINSVSPSCYADITLWQQQPSLTQTQAPTLPLHFSILGFSHSTFWNIFPSWEFPWATRGLLISLNFIPCLQLELINLCIKYERSTYVLPNLEFATQFSKIAYYFTYAKPSCFSPCH